MATKPKATPAPKSTAVALAKSAKSSSVVSIQEALKAQAAAMSDRTAPPSGSSILVTQDKKFKLPDGTTTAGPLQLVIVDFTARNEFYPDAFDPNDIVPPHCFAIGQNPLKLVPSDNSPEKQASDCSSCPMNQFGSQGKGKACKNARLLAVMPPDGDADTPLWTLKVSPTALKSFDGFVQSVARTFQMPPVAVVATVSFDPSVTYASLRFSDPEPNENMAVHFARQAEAAALLTVEPDVSQFEAKAAKPAKKAVSRGSNRR